MSLNYFSDELIHECSNPNCNKQVDECQSHVSMTEDCEDTDGKIFFCNFRCFNEYKEYKRTELAEENQSTHKSPDGFPFVA